MPKVTHSRDPALQRSKPIETTITRVLFYSGDTGFASIRCGDASGDLVIVGNTLLPPVPGMKVHAEGAWGTHPKHGKQFQATILSLDLPRDVETCARILCTLLGEDVLALDDARAIARATGGDLNQRAALESSGAPPDVVEYLIRVWEATKVDAESVQALREQGFSANLATTTVRFFAPLRVIDILQRNPYRLVEAPGVSFTRIDEIALKLGVERSSEIRVIAGLREAARLWSEEGHTVCDEAQLLRGTATLLGLHANEVEPFIVDAAQHKALVRRQLLNGADDQPRIVYQLPALHRAERRTAEALVEFVRQHAALRVPTDEQIANVLGFAPDREQLQGIIRAFHTGASVITGGPGFGKTSIARAVWKLYPGPRLAWGPTGMAAKRLAMSIGDVATTAHRGLGVRGGGDGGFLFKHGPDNPLDLQDGLLLLDEVTQYDTALMASIWRALPPSARVLMLGDVDQLPSVGPGECLRDVIDVGVPTTYLRTLYRTGAGSPIPIFGRAIMDAQLPELPRSGPLRFVPVASNERPAEVIGAVKALIRQGADVSTLRVLSPMRVGPFGCDVLNTVLQRVWNPKGLAAGGIPNGHSFESIGGETYAEQLCVGDRVMQRANDYDRDIYNGDILTVTGIINEKGKKGVVAVIDDREVMLDNATALRHLRLAYAQTIYTMMGSDEEHIVMALVEGHKRMLYRRHVYTGVTRAKETLSIVGDERALSLTVQDYGAPIERQTGLCEAIADAHAARIVAVA